MCCCLVLLVFSSSITSIMDSEASKKLEHCCICRHMSGFRPQLDKHMQIRHNEAVFEWFLDQEGQK